MFAYEIPIATPSASNLREHWRARAARVAEQRRCTWAATLAAGVPILFERQHATVRLIRVSPRRLDDDNLRGALKGARDQIADALGVDDADPRVAWRYGQLAGRTPSVRVEVRVYATARA